MSHDFTPTLFIDIGETGAFFTLRETYLHTTYLRGEGDSGGAVVNGVYQGTIQTEVRSFHHFNLSQDANEAVAKAQEVAEKLGLRLEANASTLALQMRDIHRATAEELATREAAYAAKRAEWEAERNAGRLEALATVARGIYPGKKYQGKPFAEIPRSFLKWVAETTFEEGSMMAAVGEAIRGPFAHLLPPVPKQDAFLGKIGQRLLIEAEVIGVHSFTRGSFSGYGHETVYIVTMVTPEGVCLVSKSSSFSAYDGEKLKIKCTVKEHDSYKGQAQTVVQRIVVIDEKEAA